MILRRAVFIGVAIVGVAAGCSSTFRSRDEPKQYKVLTILWDPHRPGVSVATPQRVEELLFGSAPSVADYYERQSNGGVEIVNAGIVGWFDAKHPWEHYWETRSEPFLGFTSGHVEKWTEALRKADDTIDFASFDTNHDGTLTPDELGVCIVIPQTGPFGTVRNTAAREVPSYEPLRVDGIAIPTISEVYLDINSGFGIFAHELGHLLFGFPDMYGAPKPAGPYSLMDASYGDTGLDPYNKYRHAWLRVVDVTGPGVYSLRAIQDSGEVLRLVRPEKPREFFLFENRARGATYDSRLPDQGIAVWRILDDTEGDWGRTNIALLRRGAPPDDMQSLWHLDPRVNRLVLNLTWADGVPSGYSLEPRTLAGETMEFELVRQP
jgi:immune inhibitor A